MEAIQVNDLGFWKSELYKCHDALLSAAVDTVKAHENGFELCNLMDSLRALDDAKDIMTRHVARLERDRLECTTGYGNCV